MNLIQILESVGWLICLFLIFKMLHEAFCERIYKDCHYVNLVLEIMRIKDKTVKQALCDKTVSDYIRKTYLSQIKNMDYLYSLGQLVIHTPDEVIYTGVTSSLENLRAELDKFEISNIQVVRITTLNELYDENESEVEDTIDIFVE